MLSQMPALMKTAVAYFGIRTRLNLLTGIGFTLLLLFLGVWIFFMRQMQGGGAGRGAMSFGKSKARMLSEDQVKVNFSDVAGCEEAKDEVKELVDFLKDPSKFQKLGGKIPSGGSLPNENSHPQPKPLFHLIQRGTLVIGTHPGGGVGLEPVTRQTGAVTIDGPTGKRVDLRVHPGVAENRPGHVHDLGETNHPRVPREFLEIRGIELGAGGRQVGRRHTGRRHEEHGQGQAFRRIEHPPHAVHACNIGDLVRVGNDRRRTSRNHSAGVFLGGHHGTLEVHVGIHEPGQQESAVEIVETASKL